MMIDCHGKTNEVGGEYMGLIRAAAGAVGGTLADQWKEFFYCDALPANVLATKAQKRTSGRSATEKARKT